MGSAGERRAPREMPNRHTCQRLERASVTGKAAGWIAPVHVLPLECAAGRR
jgi:hypothetical protein